MEYYKNLEELVKDVIKHFRLMLEGGETNEKIIVSIESINKFKTAMGEQLNNYPELLELLEKAENQLKSERRMAEETPMNLIIENFKEGKND